MTTLLWKPTNPNPYRMNVVSDKLLAALEREFGYFPFALNVTHLDRLRGLVAADPALAEGVLMVVDAVKRHGEIEVSYES